SKARRRVPVPTLLRGSATRWTRDQRVPGNAPPSSVMRLKVSSGADLEPLRELLDLEDGRDLLRRLLEVVGDAAPDDLLAVEEDVARAVVAVARLADRAHVHDRLALLPRPLVVQ